MRNRRSWCAAIGSSTSGTDRGESGCGRVAALAEIRTGDSNPQSIRQVLAAQPPTLTMSEAGTMSSAGAE